MADVTLTYKGNTIAEMSASGSKTIQTAGKYCEADIGLTYVRPQSGPIISGGKLVKFYDYDGTLIAAKTAAEINEMTDNSDLPANPTHTGLVSQGWNWTLAQLKSYLTKIDDGTVHVGQMYNTTSGATEIYITLTSSHFLSPYLAIAVNGTVEVDWGDNTTADTMTGTSNTTLVFQQHTYQSIGDYVVKITVTTGKFTFYMPNTSYASVFRSTNGNSNLAKIEVYKNSIKVIRIGNNANIGKNAFYYCYALTSLTIPNSVTSINNTAFSNCYALTSLTIPDSVTTIGNSAFYNCYALASLTIPDSVTSIGNDVFNNCYTLTSLTIPDSVTSIGSSAFYNCYALTSLTIPDSVTSIGSSAFYNCYALTSLTIPDSVTTIGNSAFNNCCALASLTIPDSVTTIGNSVFNNCYNLASLTIPDSVTSIDTNAFYNCYALTSLTIPDSVTTIGNSAFSNCYALTEIHMMPTTPPTLSSTIFSHYNASTFTIYVPTGTLSDYQSASYWSSYASYMQEESA